MKVAPTHDEILIDADGKLCGYATMVPNGTSVLNGHPAPRIRASGSGHGSPSGAAISAGGPAAMTPASVPAGSEADDQPDAAAVARHREQVRSMAARQGHLPPASLDEATYPGAWFTPAERAKMGGAA